MIILNLEKTYWLGLSASNWIAIAATCITAVIVIVGLIQWASTRKAHMQSHKPIIRTDYRMPNAETEGYVKITNCGLGPALLQEINFYINNEKILGDLSNSSSTTIKKIARSTRGRAEITELQNFQEGYPVSRDESKVIIKFFLSGLNNHLEFEKELINQGVQVEVKYKDIFNRDYISLDPQPGKAL